MFIRGLIISIVLFSLWQGLTWLCHIPPYLLPSPVIILQTLIQQFPLILQHASITCLETLVGLFLACVLACLAAISMSYFKKTKQWLMPILLFSQILPVFAIAPLLVLWFGYGMTSKIIITVMMLFFPITSAFFDGLCRTEQGWLDLAITMNASPWQQFWHIRIPAALPSLASGLRIATVTAPLGAIIGEWVGSSYGLGYLMLMAHGRMQIDLMFAVLLILVLFSIILYFSVDHVLRKLIFWQKITLI